MVKAVTVGLSDFSTRVVTSRVASTFFGPCARMACGRLLAGFVLAAAVHAAGAHGPIWQAEHRLAEFAKAAATIERTPSVISKVAMMTDRTQPSGVGRTVSDMLDEPAVGDGLTLRGGEERAKSEVEETSPVPPLRAETSEKSEQTPQGIEQTHHAEVGSAHRPKNFQWLLPSRWSRQGNFLTGGWNFLQGGGTFRINYRASSEWPDAFLHFSRDGGKTWSVRRGHRQVAAGAHPPAMHAQNSSRLHLCHNPPHPRSSGNRITRW